MKFCLKPVLNYLYIRSRMQKIILKKIKNKKCIINETINIAISTNEKFIEQTLVFISSLENCGCNVKLYVLNINLSNILLEKMNSISPSNVTIIEKKINQKLINDLLVSDKWPIEAWARILIPQIIDEKYVIYMDVDCVVIENISKLCEKYSGYTLSGVRSSYYYNEHYKKNGINSGVIIMNIEKLKTFHFTEKVMEYARKNVDKLVMPDQDSINSVCSNEIGIMPLKYNVMNFLFANTANIIEKKINDKYYDEEDYKEAIFKPSIIHYNGGPFARPWKNKGVKHPYYKVYKYYLRKIRTKTGEVYND